MDVVVVRDYRAVTVVQAAKAGVGAMICETSVERGGPSPCKSAGG